MNLFAISFQVLIYFDIVDLIRACSISGRVNDWFLFKNDHDLARRRNKKRKQFTANKRRF